MKPVAPKVKYTPSVSKMIGQCTFNYVLLKRLVPDLRSLKKNDQVNFLLDGLEGSREQEIAVTCTITEVAPYTTFLTFTQTIKSLSTDTSGLLQLRFLVRLYHDAQLAEVVDAERNTILPGKFDYPNERMFQSDEKEQCNQFFGQWLENCRHSGLAQWESTVGSQNEMD